MATVQYDAKTGKKLAAGATTTDALGNVYKQGTTYAPTKTSQQAASTPVQQTGSTLTPEQVKAGYSTIPGAYDPLTGNLKSTTTKEAAAPQVTPKITQTSTTPASTVAPTTPTTVQTGAASSAYQAPTQDQQLQNLMSSKLSDTDKSKVAQNLGLSEKYKTALVQAQASGQQAPVTGEGSQVTAPYMQPAEPDMTEMYNTLYNDPGYQQLLADKKEYDDIANQKTSLVDEYNQMIKDSGLKAINAKLINTKNIIDGTEDDIRTEITKADGFATDSQVMAMANARNKVLIKNYNNLLDTKQSIMDNVNTMIGLAEKDRTNAINASLQKLNIDQQIIDYSQKMQTNAQNTYQKVIDQAGYSGLMAMTNGDPYYTSLVEKTLGLAPGGLSQLASQPNIDQQIKEAQLANIKADTAKTYAGMTPTSTAGYNGEFAATIDLASNLEKSVAGKKAIREQLQSDIANGDYASAYSQIINTVQSNLSGTLASNFGQQRQDYNALAGLREAVTNYANSGGDMNLLKGTEEQIKRKLGIDSGNASRMAVQLWRDFQTYRLNMTGAAFSPAESRDYAAVNPTLGKSLDLNLNIIDGALDQLENKVNSTVDTYVPSAKYMREYAQGGTSQSSTTQDTQEDWISKLSPEQLSELINEGLITQ